MASCDHKWGPWSGWSQDCESKRSKSCEKCRQVITETNTWHNWGATRDDKGRSVIECRRCHRRR